MSTQNLQQQTMSLGQNVASSAAGGAVGMGLEWLDELVMGNRRRKKQLEQQAKLNEMQIAGNKELSDYQQQKQLEMFEKTGYGAQMKQMKEAGLNPAMIYGMSGGGVEGTTGGGNIGSVGGGHASDESSRKMASIQAQGMALQNRMMQAEVKKVEAETENLEAQTDNTKSRTVTENEQRDILIENIKQQGLEKWLHNVQERYKMQGNPDNEEGTGWHSNAKLNEEIFINEGSYIQRELTTAILKMQADTGSAEAQALLTNKKAEGYYRELMNEIIKAEAQKKSAESSEIVALAIKLSAEFDTGEFTNWKTWTDLGIEGASALGNIVGKFTPTKSIIKKGK